MSDGTSEYCLLFVKLTTKAGNKRNCLFDYRKQEKSQMPTDYWWLMRTLSAIEISFSMFTEVPLVNYLFMIAFIIVLFYNVIQKKFTRRRSVSMGMKLIAKNACSMRSKLAHAGTVQVFGDYCTI